MKNEYVIAIQVFSKQTGNVFATVEQDVNQNNINSSLEVCMDFIVQAIGSDANGRSVHPTVAFRSNGNIPIENNIENFMLRLHSIDWDDTIRYPKKRNNAGRMQQKAMLPIQCLNCNFELKWIYKVAGQYPSETWYFHKCDGETVRMHEIQFKSELLRNYKIITDSKYFEE